MKGFANTVMFVLMLVVIITMLVAYVSIATSGGTVQVRGVALDTQTMDTGIELAKEFVRTSAAYSLHQSCYTNLKELDSDQDAMLEKIRLSAETHLEDYSSQGYKFLEHDIRVPYYSIALEPAQSGLKLTGESDNLFSVSSTESNVSITVQDEPNFTEEIKTECWSLYLSSKGLDSRLKEAMETNASKLIAGLPIGLQTRTFAVSDAPPTYIPPTERCEIVFEGFSRVSYYDVEDNLKSLMETTVAGELQGLGSYKDLSTRLIQDFSLESEVRSTDKVEITCDLNYIAEANVSVIVEGKEKYPVWNGTNITMDKLRAEMDVRARYNPKAP